MTDQEFRLRLPPGGVVLNRDALPPGLWALLRKLMEMEALEHFFLVGGTALALRLGHRVSVDIDLFSLNPFDVDTLFEILRKETELL